MTKKVRKVGFAMIPAQEAGSLFGYTSDYITRLAREGKVDGEKRGRSWFVSEESACAFFEEVELRKKERSDALRAERKAELNKHTSSTCKEESDVVSTPSPFGIQKNDVPVVVDLTRVAPVGTLSLTNVGRAPAVLSTALIALVGITAGAITYLGSLNLSNTHYASLGNVEQNVFEWMAISLYTFVTPGVQIGEVTESTELSSEVVEGVLEMEAVSEDEYVAGGEGIVVFPDNEVDAATLAAVRESFSDEVTVSIDENISDTGVITPRFKSGREDEYRFLLVPMDSGN